MSDTSLERSAPSDEKLCTECGDSFGQKDDKRYARCVACRKGTRMHDDAELPGPESLDAETLDLDEFPAEEAAAKETYWCGIVPDAPFQFVTAGGFEFPKDRGRIQVDGDRLMMVDHVYPGVIHRLTEREIALIKERIAAKVVRRRGQSSVLISRTGMHRRPYRAAEGDIPLGRYVFMVRVNGGGPPMFAGTPPTLVR